MDWGETYIDTFLLHIEKNKGNIGMIRLVDATAPEFYQKEDLRRKEQMLYLSLTAIRTNLALPIQTTTRQQALMLIY